MPTRTFVQRLIEERASVWEDAKALLDRAESENRDLDAVEQSQWQAYTDRLSGLDSEIEEKTRALDAAKQADEIRERFADVPAAKTQSQPSDEDRLRKLASGEVKSVEFRFGPGEARDILKTGSGANTVPTSFLARLYQHMIDNSAIRQTNVTVLTTDSGEDLQVPKTTVHSTAGIIAEGAAISESDPTFAQVTLGAFKYAFITQVSSEILTDTGIDLEGYLAAMGGEALGNASGAHFVTGSGSGQPNGAVTAATVGVTGSTGVSGVFTADNLISLFFSVIAPYRRRGYWMMADAAVEDLRTLKDSNNQYLWQPSLVVGEPNTLLGRPLVVDTNVADPALSAKSVLFGDLSAYFIRDVNGVRIERSDDFAFNTDLATFRFILRTDGDLVDTTGAVKVFQGGAS